jgi:hypothetical protein
VSEVGSNSLVCQFILPTDSLVARIWSGQSSDRETLCPTLRRRPVDGLAVCSRTKAVCLTSHFCLLNFTQVDNQEPVNANSI